VRIIDCDTCWSNGILAILNEAIANSTAIYDYTPRTPEMMSAWFDVKRRNAFPVVGAVSPENTLMGFASYGTFRPLPAYKYTVEHSVYVAAPFRGKGIGTRLLAEIIARAKKQDVHVLVGGIDSTNEASIALHRRFGFELVATMPQVGYKFGRWLDLCFYQLVLETPAKPDEV
jgi:phosphinothricin acetyltransferase